MQFAVLAFSGGALLYVASAAAAALSARQVTLEPWFLAVLPVVLAHAASGFLAVGGWAACVKRSAKGIAACVIASATITAATAVVASLAAIKSQISMGPGIARIILLLCFAASIAELVLAIQLTRGRGVLRV